MQPGHDEIRRDDHPHGPQGQDARRDLRRDPQRGPATDPTPQYVYWIRRAVALALLVAALSLLAWGVSALVSLFSSNEPDKADPAPQSSTAEKPAKDGDPTNNPDKADNPKACDAATVELVLTSERKSVAAGASMPFSIQVKNQGETDCILDVSPTSTAITVMSGEDRIWSSADCDESGTKALFMEKRAETTSVSVWDGVRSNESCDSGLPAAKPGTYRAVAQYGTAKSNELVFQVK